VLLIHTIFLSGFRERFICLAIVLRFLDSRCPVPSSSYEPVSYEPVAADVDTGYVAQEQDLPSTEEQPKKKSIMDDDDDDLAARAAAIQKAENDRHQLQPAHKKQARKTSWELEVRRVIQSPVHQLAYQQPKKKSIMDDDDDDLAARAAAIQKAENDRKANEAMIDFFFGCSSVDGRSCSWATYPVSTSAATGS
jgi:hypothetical protein